jgi:hypothetical protein
MKLFLGSKEQLMLSQAVDVATRFINQMDHPGDKEGNLNSFAQSVDYFSLMRKMANDSFPEVDQFESFMDTSALTDASQYVLMTSGRKDVQKNEDFQWKTADAMFTDGTKAPNEKYVKEKSFLDLETKKVVILL